MVFSWLFRGPLLSRKTVFGPFSLLFRGFFVAPVLGKFYAYSPWNSLLIFVFLFRAEGPKRFVLAGRLGLEVPHTRAQKRHIKSKSHKSSGGTLVPVPFLKENRNSREYRMRFFAYSDKLRGVLGEVFLRNSAQRAKHEHSGPLRLRVQSRSRTRLRMPLSRFCFALVLKGF